MHAPPALFPPSPRPVGPVRVLPPEPRDPGTRIGSSQPEKAGAKRRQAPLRKWTSLSLAAGRLSVGAGLLEETGSGGTER